MALRDGDAVQDQQLLARIAPLPLSERERKELTARVAAAQALQLEARQRVRQSADDLGQAQRELQRMRQLARDGFIAPQGLEQAIQKEMMATSALESARFRARAAAADVQAAQAAMDAIRAAQSGAQGWLEVRAPMAGRVLRINDPSERVVAIGTLLMSLGDVRHLEVVIELLSTEAVKVAPGMPVLIDGWGGQQVLRARVRQVESYAFTKVSALGIEEKRVNVIADFDEPPPALGDGFRLTARIVVWQAEQVLKVPASALYRCGQAWCVFVVEGGRARQRTLALGHRNLQEAQVADGLRAGEHVVRYPGNALQDGARVRWR
jgi:HlyD family secretion protein